MKMGKNKFSEEYLKAYEEFSAADQARQEAYLRFLSVQQRERNQKASVNNA